METNHPWTKPYRDVVDQQYRLDDAARQEFNEFFVRLDAMASASTDQGTFVTRFLQSPLYTEYNELLGKFQPMALAATGETIKEAVVSMRKESDRISAEDHAKTMAEQKLNEVISQALPDELNRLRWGGLRALPVVGPILQWIGNFRWLKALFTKK